MTEKPPRKTMRNLVMEILTENQELSFSEIRERVEVSGYVTKAKSFDAIVSQALHGLRRDGLLERSAHKHWCLAGKNGKLTPRLKLKSNRKTDFFTIVKEIKAVVAVLGGPSNVLQTFRQVTSLSEKCGGFVALSTLIEELYG